MRMFLLTAHARDAIGAALDGVTVGRRAAVMVCHALRARRQEQRARRVLLRTFAEVFVRDAARYVRAAVVAIEESVLLTAVTPGRALAVFALSA